jgi:hypothetical protein
MISLSNHYRTAVYLAFQYRDVNCSAKAEEQWRTQGWFSFQPGENHPLNIPELRLLPDDNPHYHMHWEGRQ